MPATERLLLRRFTPADAGAMAAMNADPDVMRHIADGRPQTRAESDAFLARVETHWDTHGFGLWCVTTRDDPRGCLGFAGLAVPAFLPEVLPAVEVGWRLRRDAWGHGYATEAARASLAVAFGELGLGSVISLILAGNERSVRVAEKLGMSRGRDRLGPAGRRLHVYEISRKERDSGDGTLDPGEGRS